MEADLVSTVASERWPSDRGSGTSDYTWLVDGTTVLLFPEGMFCLPFSYLYQDLCVHLGRSCGSIRGWSVPGCVPVPGTLFPAQFYQAHRLLQRNEGRAVAGMVPEEGPWGRLPSLWGNEVFGCGVASG